MIPPIFKTNSVITQTPGDVSVAEPACSVLIQKRGKSILMFCNWKNKFPGIGRLTFFMFLIKQNIIFYCDNIARGSELILSDGDNNLFKKVREGNKKAFRKIYDKYWEKLYFISLSKINSKEDAEDIIHDLFCDIWKNRKNIEIKTNFSAYLFTALKYKIFRYIDHKTVVRKHLEIFTPDKEYGFDEKLEDNVWFGELYSKYEQKVEELPEKCRAVFKLSRFKNYKLQRIAKELDISPNTAQNHINKALKIIRLELDKILLMILFLFP